MLNTFGAPEERPWGVDISQVQGKCDFAALAAAGCSWVTAKATEGSTFVDPMWERNARAIKDAGMLLDAYWFMTTGSSIEMQVAHFCNVVLGVIDLPPCVDFEAPPPERWIPPVTAGYLIARAIEATDKLQERFGPLREIVYTYPYFMQAIARAAGQADLLKLSNSSLWIASYHDEKHAPKLTDFPTVPRPWGKAQWWQWSGDKGLPAPGIPCVVDHDVFMGTYAELRALLLPTSESGPAADDCPDTQPAEAEITKPEALG